ncbi:hypothetical protein FHS40_007066 [Streptomyces spectabilis]|uniref:Uncharacterized protein n=1 Tax=Streptomyces spectabilis TaxID=68270 RepID=A0A7W8B2G7_STRST|nr:hypothetical protein [Streptomyces spectabilis]
MGRSPASVRALFATSIMAVSWTLPTTPLSRRTRTSSRVGVDLHDLARCEHPRLVELATGAVSPWPAGRGRAEGVRVAGELVQQPVGSPLGRHLGLLASGRLLEGRAHSVGHQPELTLLADRTVIREPDGPVGLVATPVVRDRLSRHLVPLMRSARRPWPAAGPSASGPVPTPGRGRFAGSAVGGSPCRTSSKGTGSSNISSSRAATGHRTPAPPPRTAYPRPVLNLIDPRSMAGTWWSSKFLDSDSHTRNTSGPNSA